MSVFMKHLNAIDELLRELRQQMLFEAVEHLRGEAPLSPGAQDAVCCVCRTDVMPVRSAVADYLTDLARLRDLPSPLWDALYHMCVALPTETATLTQNRALERDQQEQWADVSFRAWRECKLSAAMSTRDRMDATITQINYLQDHGRRQLIGDVVDFLLGIETLPRDAEEALCRLTGTPSAGREEVADYLTHVNCQQRISSELFDKIWKFASTLPVAACEDYRRWEDEWGMCELELLNSVPRFATISPDQAISLDS